ncbi:hypothetical protein [Rhodospirillum rubrum]|uniref:Uncharacterized protein n=1 Tax=Rhodospirillum rubrum (strain ATCC 11170 / ATH 1.1.1 / DSM 467 / LMG 4362 / NCIMB 8255 / S1) TaxID=269796 RepID=Q2RXX0_RHORT|nr:hypothetical protein [Rhodospirillum rubrum]ABC21025.1 conserved hypothetical protein [Rhodospirillum rubrum ATCC 11170]AEO46691.1 hypothetical protein F11_01105 [Rhodospirillum rubrum F11]MBK5952569.1 hypothetical protein [Rhodospirillum rubrum]QXG80721.1 hypothetical protein KUL73_01165 [Rhodospirillum rubrum]HAP99069.1 hypothetical protein [Rhodospirillum rubrum]
MTTYECFKEKVEGRNIHPETLLATDYLNHFNEVIMLLEMVPDMPDILEDCKEWQPKSYADHFRDSGFSDRELAIAAYDHVPERFKKPFEETVEQMNTLALLSITRTDEAFAEGRPEVAAERARAGSRALQKMIDVASAIIHGGHGTFDQAQIDDMMAP